MIRAKGHEKTIRTKPIFQLNVFIKENKASNRNKWTLVASETLNLLKLEVQKRQTDIFTIVNKISKWLRQFMRLTLDNDSEIDSRGCQWVSQ